MTQKTPESLDRLWDDIPIRAAPLDELLTAGQAAKRKHGRVLIGVAAAVTLVLGGGYLAIQTVDPRTQREQAAADAAPTDLTVHVLVGSSTEVTALGLAANTNTALWNGETRHLIYVSPMAYSSSCPPQGTATASEGPGVTLELSTEHVDGPCRSDAAAVTTTISGLSQPPSQITVAADGTTTRVPVKVVEPLARDQVRVPNVTGLNLTQARAALQDVGLDVSVTETTCPPHANCIPGVVDIIPSPGDVVTPGSTVRLTVMSTD